MNLFPPPGPERKRQMISLAVLVAVLAGLLWYRFGPTDAVATASKSPVRPTTTIDPVKLPEPLKLAVLDTASEDSNVGRNPFTFGSRPAPPPPPMPAYVPPPPEAPPPPPAPTGPPPITLRLMGLLVDPRSGRTMATLRDPASPALFQVFEGDIVDGRYRVVKIGLQSVVVSYVDGTGTRTISLGG